MDFFERMRVVRDTMPYIVTYREKIEHREFVKIIQWCGDEIGSFEDDWYHHMWQFFFKHERDAILFKLRWVG